jgi:hypothetical protein
MVALGFSSDGKSVMTAGNSADQRGTAWLWAAPEPVADDLERLTEWMRLLTGLQLDGGVSRVMGREAWEKSRERLEELGGAPTRRER